MITIPGQDKKWVQKNNSNVNGNIWASYNIDLTDNDGRVRVGDRGLLNTSNADQANLGIPVAFRPFTVNGISKIFSVAGSRIFSTLLAYPAAPFTQDATSNTPVTCSSDYSDMEIFNGKLYVTTNTTVVYNLNSSGTWSNINTITSNNYPHLLCTFANRMYMTTKQGASITSWDTSESVKASPGTDQYTIELNNTDTSTTYITFIRAASNRIWIGTMNPSGGKAYIYEWDGASNQPTKSYRLDSSGALACAIKDDVPYIMDTNGVLQYWNGGTFKPLASLNRKNNYLLYNPLNLSNDRFVHPNGMSVIEGNINILINTQNYNSTSNTEETIPAGVWEYTEDTGLYHKYSLGLGKVDASPFTDYGQIKVASVGALTEMNIPNTGALRNGTFLAGAKYYTNATATAQGIFYNDSLRSKQKAGYFISTKIDSANVTEQWNKFYVKHRKLISSSDKIVAKFRSDEQDASEVTINWVSTTGFTSSDSALANYSIGDEVQVIQGIGSGKPSHITSIQATDSGYMVGVDETYLGATGTTAKVWVNKWKKMNPIIQNTTRNYGEMGIPAFQSSPSAQFKIWMLFTHPDELESVSVIDSPSQGKN